MRTRVGLPAPTGPSQRFHSRATERGGLNHTRRFGADSGKAGPDSFSQKLDDASRRAVDNLFENEPMFRLTEDADTATATDTASVSSRNKTGTGSRFRSRRGSRSSMKSTSSAAPTGLRDHRVGDLEDFIETVEEAESEGSWSDDSSSEPSGSDEAAIWEKRRKIAIAGLKLPASERTHRHAIAIVDTLASLTLRPFRLLDDAQMLMLSSVIYLEDHEPQSAVVQSGSVPNCTKVILEGSCGISAEVDLLSRQKKSEMELHAGDIISEFALVSEAQAPHTLTVSSPIPAKLLCCTREDYQRILALNKTEFHHKLEFLQSLPLFHSVPERDLSHFATLLEDKVWLSDQTLILQGEVPDFLHLIVSGHARVTRQTNPPEPSARKVARLVQSIDFLRATGGLHKLSGEPSSPTSPHTPSPTDADATTGVKAGWPIPNPKLPNPRPPDSHCHRHRTSDSGLPPGPKGRLHTERASSERVSGERTCGARTERASLSASGGRTKTKKPKSVLVDVGLLGRGQAIGEETFMRCIFAHLAGQEKNSVRSRALYPFSVIANTRVSTLSIGRRDFMLRAAHSVRDAMQEASKYRVPTDPEILSRLSTRAAWDEFKTSVVEQEAHRKRLSAAVKKGSHWGGAQIGRGPDWGIRKSDWTMDTSLRGVMDHLGTVRLT